MLDHSCQVQWHALSKMLSYDADTGEFRWRVNRANQRAGSIAGNIGPNGYRTICVNYKSYYAHHLALILSGQEPPLRGSHVDHIDGDRANNRLVNLRVVSPSVNGLNRRRPNKNNTSGVPGVWQTPSGKFLAYIDVGRKRQRVGLFATKEQAQKAREEAHARHSQP